MRSEPASARRVEPTAADQLRAKRGANVRRGLVCSLFVGFVVGFHLWLDVRPLLATEVACPSRAGGSAASIGEAGAIADNSALRTAQWPFLKRRPRAIYDSAPGPATPHPAVARIIVPEVGMTAYGSGTLVDVRDQYGLVVTNWHVVRDAKGVVEVAFPSGFRSQAWPLKVDRDWDLAALVIWRPPIQPVTLAAEPPQPGDLLTIHGYGQGHYRIVTGRCTTYYAPRRNFPLEMVEVDVEARQGDSGGPIFNQRGELAGVLFGAGQGTTMGSYSPRVGSFLATLAPDIGQAKEQAQVAVANRPAPKIRPADEGGAVALQDNPPNSPWTPANGTTPSQITDVIKPAGHESAEADQIASGPDASDGLVASATSHAAVTATLSWQDIADTSWYESLKSMLAVIGLAAIALQVIKIIR